jgi:hypothetical protein
MTKAKVASYGVISDNKVILEKKSGIDHDDHEFPVELDAHADVGFRSVLSFMVQSVDPSDLVFSLNIINGNNMKTEISRSRLNNFALSVFQEVVGAKVLTQNGNRLKVEVLSGSGALEISDIVLLYLKEIQLP